MPLPLLLSFVLLAPKAAKPTVTPEKAAAARPAPAAAKVPVTDTYHGVAVPDDYRWLESGDDAKVKSWSAAESAHARAFLDAVPGAPALRKEIERLLTQRPATFGNFVVRGGRVFARRSDPAHRQQAWIVVLPSLTSTDGMRTLVDPNTIDPSGNTAYDWFVPSFDGKKIAVSLSEGGSESGTLHVYDVDSGRETGDVIPRVQNGTAGGSLTWAGDGSGFWYTRYPREGERPKQDLDFFQQCFFHRLGAPESQDVYAFGRELPRIAEIFLRSSEDGRHHLALVQNGDGGDYALYVLPEGTNAWAKVSDFSDGLVEAVFGRDGSIWALSKKDAPRKRVLRIPPGAASLSDARVVLDQREGAIEGIAPTDSRLYVVEARGGTSRVHVYDLEGRPLDTLPSPAVSAVGAIAPLEGDRVFVGTTTFLQPFSGSIWDPRKKSATPTIIRGAQVADFSDAEVVEESAVSRDGTRIPMFIVQRKGTKRDGKNPVVLSGYGGFGISMQPSYSDLEHVFVERGVVTVTALLRGGGEFGEEWHEAGRLTRKQNVFDDFLACARRLVELGYTTPQRLAIHGGSNGGLLMGAAFTQAPGLFKAAVSEVGIYDMLRVETSPNGEFNTTEFGSVKDPEQFRALHAYSPYHHVADGTRYPAILMVTGDNDPRVDPMQSRKMIARLQAADPKGTILLRTSGQMGHGGIGASLAAIVSLVSDVDAFLLHELKVPLEEPKRRLRMKPGP